MPEPSIEISGVASQRQCCDLGRPRLRIQVNPCGSGSETRPPYAPEFRRQTVDLVRAGRDPTDPARHRAFRSGHPELGGASLGLRQAKPDGERGGGRGGAWAIRCRMMSRVRPGWGDRLKTGERRGESILDSGRSVWLQARGGSSRAGCRRAGRPKGARSHDEGGDATRISARNSTRLRRPANDVVRAFGSSAHLATAIALPPALDRLRLTEAWPGAVEAARAFRDPKQCDLLSQHCLRVCSLSRVRSAMP
jgi:hypothetical protein